MLLDKSRINKSVPIPLYFQLKELILSEIKNGNYKSGSMIPTENEFSEAFAISRTTIRQAITELVQEGWLYRVKSKGTFVAEPKISQDFVAKLEPFAQQMHRLGKVPLTEVLELTTMEATKTIAQNLQIPEKSPVIYLHRKRLADDTPLVVLQTYLPYNECSFLLHQDLVQQSLYELLGQSPETRIVWIQRKIEAVEATPQDQKHMGIQEGKPILYFTSIGYNAMDKPIEYSLAHYRGDRNSFEITVVPGN